MAQSIQVKNISFSILFLLIGIQFSNAQKISKQNLELISAASTFENNMIFTIGEPCVQFYSNEQFSWQEGFLQNITPTNNVSETKPPPNAKPDIRRASIYPNPNDGAFTIELFSESETPIAEYVLFNMQGQEYSRGTLSSRINHVDLYYLPNGAYIIKIFTPNHQFNFVSKLIKL